MEKKQSVVIDGHYRHYKGNEYRVIAVATHSETHEDMVVYQELREDGRQWVRPAAMFIENVSIDGQEVPRFQLFHSEQS